MRASPKPPKLYEEFVRRYPKLGQAWEAIAEGGKDGPIDEKTARLVKLGVAIGALREGAIHSSVRKALAQAAHPSTLETLRRYAALRDASFPDCRDAAFFVTLRQRRFARNTLQQAVCKIARRAGLRGPTGISFHSLRHRFAVKRLIAWYEAGVDVQAMLPMLATYMGHVCYSDTAYYLTATPELLGLAAKRCQAGDRP